MIMGPKLLLADDSVTIQRVIELTFADEDIDVQVVGDGAQAIEQIKANAPDIVLADTSMPEKDGYDVAAFVKNNPTLAHIPVVLLTGAFEPLDSARAEAVGTHGVLVKPFEPQQVIGKVRELLASSAVAAHDRPPESDAVLAPAASGPTDLLRAPLATELPGVETPWAPAIPVTPPAPTPFAATPLPGVAPVSPATGASEAASGDLASSPVPQTASPVSAPPASAPASSQHAAGSVLAQAFATLLAGERGVPPPRLDAATSMDATDAPMPEAMVNDVVQRVVARMTDAIVRDTTAEIVLEVAERLVRDEIDHIKTDAR